MTIKRTFKYQLINLSKTTTNKLEQNLEISCQFHNYLLKEFRDRDKRGEKQPTKYELINSIVQIKEDNPIFRQVHSTTLQEISKQVHGIWKKNEELKKLDPKKKHPNFKPTHRYNSFTYSQPIEKSSCGYKVDNVPLSEKVENRKLKLSFGKINNRYCQFIINIRMERNIEGDIKTLTIKRKNNKYYTLFSCDNIQTKSLPLTGKIVGMDVNLNKKSFITLSNGVKYKHPKHYKKLKKN
ncbi:MAG: transposase IS605 [Mycoplasmataceae bacterium RV_VA103A]|nr:MAG: transposase IS605 [Mycoplasmataceae bacterium RV_VA103A]